MYICDADEYNAVPGELKTNRIEGGRYLQDNNIVDKATGSVVSQEPTI